MTSAICETALAAVPNAPSNAELFALIKTLQSRVAVLESQAESYRKEVDAAQAALKMAARSEPSGGSEFQPLRLAAPTTEHSVSKPRLSVSTADDPPIPQWSGIFWGASFTGGFTQSHVNSHETYMSNFPGNSFPFQTQTESAVAKSSGHDGGAALDVFTGVNKQFGSHLIGGIQIEGSVADLSFDSAGTRSVAFYNDAGPTGVQNTGSFRPHLHSRWMVSALARAGLLVSPTTLTYGLVGWTGAQFDYQDLTDNLFFQPGDGFWANGITFGGGVEQKLAADCSIGAEYRYTNFPSVNVDNNFQWSSNFPSTQSNTIRTKFEENLQTVRLGVSYLLR